jgi:outer membrane protein insertion porin family
MRRWRVAVWIGAGTAALASALTVAAQTAPVAPVVQPAGQIATGVPVGGDSVWGWRGLKVTKIEFEGVTYEAGDPLLEEIAQKAGQPLDPDKVRSSVRRLFATGRYRDVQVHGIREADGVVLTFSGAPQYYVGRVTILGVRNERLSSLLQFTTKLDPGTAFTESQIDVGTEGIKQTLEQNGYFEPKVTVVSSVDSVGSQVNVTYTVDIGPQAGIGQVALQGDDPGVTLEEFRKRARLRPRGRFGGRNRVSRDTVSNALTNMRTFFQKRNRLEATVSLQKETYVPERQELDYEFHVNQGPEVKVDVEGVKLSKNRLRQLVPIFEEGTIDNDLLNEGKFNIREYLQQQGFFNASVDVRQLGAGTATSRVVFTADKGLRHKVVSVTTEGNKYFDDDLLRERLRVQRSDSYQRNGRFSQSLVNQDVNSILALYRANGFSKAKVTADVQDIDKSETGKELSPGQIHVRYKIEEGPQQKFGTVNLTGVDPSRMQVLKGLLNSQTGQPFSLINLTGDRDTLLTYYISHGFDQARVEIRQQPQGGDSNLTDVTLNVTEGQQVFVNHLLISGIEHTRPSVVDNTLQIRAGNPLNQAALLETQRRLYNLALFNQVNAAVQNPAGNAPRKNVLLQLTEAKRWDVTYGFGIEAQTGTPQAGMISEASRIQLGLPPGETITQEGRAGISPRVSLDITRLNLRGTENSLTLHTAFGLLERIATLSYTDPHLLGGPNFSNTISGGYTNVQDITTFKSSTTQFNYKVTQRVSRADTLIYDWTFRLVKVDPNSLQVSADLIPLLSQPVRVGGPGVTYLHDTRQPGPLNAAKGRYFSLQEFTAWSGFGSQTDFNRVDVSYATYYEFGKRKYVFARKTRLGLEQSYGANPNVGNTACEGILLTTNPSCSAVPLPERLYAGGATSHRGFGINAAGPRDLQTGYPVGGTAAFVNSFELRMPAPVLPFVGSSVNFVLFHDMGNVFQNASDLLPSFARIRQPDRDTCKNVSGQIGTCSFNYFSHALGLGVRYRTPVGPIRLDFSYNLNPPIYPVIYDFNNNPPHVGQANHFNFFFSIGESF